MTRAEHVRWAKDRAHAYLERGDLASAVASILSDLGKHPDTGDIAVNAFLGMVGMLDVMSGDEHAVRRFIDGFAE